MTGKRRLIGIAISVLAALALLGFFLQGHAGFADQNDEDTPPPKAPISRTPNGDPVLHIDAAMQTRIGLRTVVLSSSKYKPELTAYGKLEEDPSRSFTLRSPISGILRYPPGQDWPSLGEHLPDRAVIGAIVPRFTPAERIGFTSQLATALSEQSTSKAAVTAARAAYERARILNADNKNISDQALQDAAALLQGDEARLKAANETVRQIDNSLQSADPSGSRKLTIERGGEVVQLTAQPGESIEPGSPILRLANFNELLARIDVPVGEHVPASVSQVRIMPAGFNNESLVATRVAVAPAIDSRIQGEALLFRLKSNAFGLRPGVAVTAQIQMPGTSQTGVLVPQAAVVRYEGLGFAYIQIAADKFVRRQIALDRPMQTGFFTPENFRPGDRVVVVGAQALLSEEFKSQVVDTD